MKKENWEKKFASIWALGGLDYPEPQDDQFNEIKTFIRQQIGKERQRLREEINEWFDNEYGHDLMKASRHDSLLKLLEK